MIEDNLERQTLMIEDMPVAMVEHLKKIQAAVEPALSVARLLAKLTASSTITAILQFKPTSECINNLPDELRNYIRDLETKCDPAGDVAARRILEDQVKQLRRVVGKRCPYGESTPKRQLLIDGFVGVRTQRFADDCEASGNPDDEIKAVLQAWASCMTDEEIREAIKNVNVLVED